LEGSSSSCSKFEARPFLGSKEIKKLAFGKRKKRKSRKENKRIKKGKKAKRI
jgi:hypothetical protein